MIAFLKNDRWTRAINLKNNSIGEEGIKNFAEMLKEN